MQSSRWKVTEFLALTKCTRHYVAAGVEGAPVLVRRIVKESCLSPLAHLCDCDCSPWARPLGALGSVIPGLAHTMKNMKKNSRLELSQLDSSQLGCIDLLKIDEIAILSRAVQKCTCTYFDGMGGKTFDII
eukprot:4997188-Ditylum_brightwellii.AAC.1